jgi:hypothetical protein
MPTFRYFLASLGKAAMKMTEAFKRRNVKAII